MTVNNIVFARNNQTRYVKHGFSWQIFFFGPLAFFMRSQPILAILHLVIAIAIYFVAAVAATFVFPDEVAMGIGLVVAFTTSGYFGNRFSARSYVKNGWLPVGDFPADWNTPKLIDVAGKAA